MPVAVVTVLCASLGDWTLALMGQSHYEGFTESLSEDIKVHQLSKRMKESTMMCLLSNKLPNVS